MTQDQMELLSDMIADKVFGRLKDYLGPNKTIVSFDPNGSKKNSSAKMLMHLVM